MAESFCPIIDEYLDLVDDTESPTIYHRWSILTALGALLNRRVGYDMTIGTIYPTQYTILIGPPATRKSTAITLATKLLRAAGYKKVAGGNTTPEQFMQDLHQGFDTLEFTRKDDDDFKVDLTDVVLPKLLNGQRISDVLIAAGELLEFLGQNNTTFASKLTNLWDNLDEIDVRTRSGDKLRINAPTLSLLGGATHATFQKIFPYDIVGQGLLSRFILVYANGPRTKVHDPKPFDEDKLREIVSFLRGLYTTELPAHLRYTKLAKDYSRHLYESGIEEVRDPRFQYYNGRRDTHYRKLCLIVAAANLHTEITETDCFLANTMLSYTEKLMPLALGEFGLDKQAEQTELVYNILKQDPEGIDMPTLLQRSLAVVHNVGELSGHIVRLTTSGRVERIVNAGTIKYSAVARLVSPTSDLVDYRILKEYRENPTFNTESKTLATKAEEALLAAEFQKIVGSMTGLAPRKRGRPPKDKGDFGSIEI